MALSRMQIAKGDILAHFESQSIRIFNKSAIAQILTHQREFWRLALHTNTDALIEFLERFGSLRRHRAEFPDRTTEIFTWGAVPLLEVLQILRVRTYYSHYTALRFHGLTEQIPKTVYLTEEPLNPSARHTPLTQDALDAAFTKPVRTTTKVATVGGVRVCLLHGNSRQGVIEGEMRDGLDPPAKIRVTNLERTLIDATVRPIYCGGVGEVLKAFREARTRASANRLRALLQKLEFLYPYHQAIGFYLQRAGYSDSAVGLFSEIPRTFDFYLTHDIGEPEYVPEWRLYVPRNF